MVTTPVFERKNINKVQIFLAAKRKAKKPMIIKINQAYLKKNYQNSTKTALKSASPGLLKRCNVTNEINKNSF